MNKTKDHHDNPELILREWKDSSTGKFYLIYRDPKSKELKITPTNEGNKIFKIRGFHPTIVDSSIIQPFERSFSKILTRIDKSRVNNFIRLDTNKTGIVDFCVRQLIGGQKFKLATKQLHDGFREDMWKNITNFCNPSKNNIVEYYSLIPRYLNLLEYENVLPGKSKEYTDRLNSMECWGILVNPNVGEFITGAQPFFFETEGEEYENMNCMRRAYFVIAPNFSIAFCDDEFGFGNGNPISFDKKRAREIILLHNTEILRRSHYVIAKRLPFIGYEGFAHINTLVDKYLVDHPTKQQSLLIIPS